MFEPQGGPSEPFFEALDEAHALMSTAMANLEPGLLDGPDAAMGVVLFSQLAKMAQAGVAFCAARVDESNHWRATADRTAAHWLARVTGASMADAMAAVEVPGRLRSLPATDAGFRGGDLSLAQARYITEAAVADPSAEERLLDVAHSEPLGTLRAECLRVRAAACTDPEERHRRIRDGRYLRHWNDESGAFRLEASLTPEAGAEVMAALTPLRKKLGRRANRRGCPERKEALLADALVELCRGGSAESRTRFTVNIRVDKSAWERGSTEAGEVCEIDGAGQIPVSVAQNLAEGRSHSVDLDDPDLATISSESRYIPARLRRALIVRDPVCVVAGCYQRDDLEFDHVIEYSKGGKTCLSNICRLCALHHWMKTSGHVLSGTGGSRQLLPPQYAEKLKQPA